MIDGYKELTPVIYGENAIKYLYTEQKKAEGEICFLLHWHDRMELTYVTEGTLRFVTEGEEFLVSAGELAVAGPGQMHGGFAVSEKVCYHTVMFDVERFYNGTAASEKYLRSLGNGELTFVEKIAGKEVSGLLERLVGLLAGRDNGKDSKSSLAAIGTLYEILGCLIEYGRSKSSAKVSPDSGFGQILTYVNHHYTKKLSPAALSAQFGYHEAYFCRRFRELTGITFSEYVRALRMEYAQKLLKESEDEVGTVAWKCGYPDGSYFTREFRKMYGFTPSQFRKMTR